MKCFQFIGVVLISALFFSCEEEKLPLNIHKQQTFEGSFKLKTDNKNYDQSGSSTLEIANGGFRSFTNGVLAAGTLEVGTHKIIFHDTVSKVYPANIIPPSSLNGTYDYTFDGARLEIGNKYESSWIEIHKLHLKK